MNLDKINQESNRRWFADNGNYTHAINYHLDNNSVVIDLGGYMGLWVDIIIKKYDPYIILVEPVPEFYNLLVNKFKDNKKVTVLNYGISIENKIDKLYLSGDGTSKYLETSKTIDVEFITISELLNKIKKNKIDLIQINIEGEEFNLLDDMIINGDILKFQNIQVQFHTFIENALSKRENIQKELLNNNFKKIYDYPFVFEGWSQKK